MIELEKTTDNTWQVSGTLERDDADLSCNLLLDSLDLHAESACDLSEVTHMDSAGLAVLLEITKQVHASHGCVRFTQLPEQLRQMVEVSGANDLLGLEM